MKILHIVDYLMPDMGYQEFLLPKWNAVHGQSVQIITSDRYCPVANYDETWGRLLGKRICGTGLSRKHNVEIVRLPIYFELKARPFLMGLRGAIKAFKPDFIMCHGTGSFSAIRAAMISKSLNIPIIFDNHMIFDVIQTGVLQKLYYFILRNFVSKYISNAATSVLGVTAESCDYLVSIEGYSPSKVSLLPLAIDSSIFYPERLNFPILDSNRPVRIIQSGKLSNDKRPIWLALAVVKLLKRGYKVTCEYVGEGSVSVLHDIRMVFKESNFSEFLTFRPMQSLEDLANIYRESHFVVFPEGTSLSAIEAAACGSVVVMADHPASKDRNAKGIGILYSRGNVDNLAEILSYLIRDSEQFVAIQRNSLAAVESHYTYEKVSRDMIGLYPKGRRNTSL